MSIHPDSSSVLEHTTSDTDSQDAIEIIPLKGGGGRTGGGGRRSGGGRRTGGWGGRWTGGKSRSSPPSPRLKLGSRTGVPKGKYISAYSPGGGKRFTLGATSPFSGRLAGGGTRGQVFGNSRYGSGYPYGGSGTYINHRPFPYVFFPIPIYPHYYGSDTYANLTETQRPGGNITTAILLSSSPNTTEIYRIIGDQLSLTSVLTSLTTECHIQNTSITPFNASDGTHPWPLPEQMIQWYRASSFGLSLDSYNKSASLPSNMPPSNDSLPPPLTSDTPLPSGLNQTYPTCLNTTIGASIPLIDPPPSISTIVVWVFTGAIALIYLVIFGFVVLVSLVDLGRLVGEVFRRRDYETLGEERGFCERVLPSVFWLGFGVGCIVLIVYRPEYLVG
ncbi:hypothetical protein JAAARDRAFT_199044 [Jaapia argillacea MUCL 33604]|uniref:Uncharacterized protein n=1 Tax=Jaapia argillacea MUCL 33604 TaxID=933084 RepID=A0A067PA04_9AGAM|nr:hypothetical protein JAAARDRAFT_199044 [Jaapia argillacea MUCL 33604]